MSSTSASHELLVACLCAQWCGTCRDYQPMFEQLQTEFANAKFVWIDIEDEADLVDPVEVDNFPTLLIAKADEVQFFGMLTPHAETLRRLIRTHMAQDAGPAPDDAAASQLVRRIRQRTV